MRPLNTAQAQQGAQRRYRAGSAHRYPLRVTHAPVARALLRHHVRHGVRVHVAGHHALEERRHRLVRRRLAGARRGGRGVRRVALEGVELG